MALVLADRVKVRSFSEGTGDFTLEANLTGFRDFSAIGDGNDTFYGITDVSGNWEIGRGKYTNDSSIQSLSRDFILSSSNNGSPVNFPSGAKNVFCTFPASAATGFQYNLSAETAIDGAIVRLAFSEGTLDDVKLVGENGITVTRTDENTINFSASALSVTQSAEPTTGGAIIRLDKDGTVDDISIIGSSGVVVTRTDANTITITSDISVTQSAEVVIGGAVLRLNQDGVTDDITLLSGPGVIVTASDTNTIAISSDISQSAETTSGGAILRLTKTATTDDVTFRGSNGIEVSRVDADTIQIDATTASGLAIVLGL